MHLAHSPVVCLPGAVLLQLQAVLPHILRAAGEATETVRKQKSLVMFGMSCQTRHCLAGLLAEDVVLRDAVVECKGLPAVMEYATVRASML